jgi:tRNA-binding EMAP/Myf-like protein
MAAPTKKEAKAQAKITKAAENKERLEILAQIPVHRAIDQENEGRKLMVECNFKSSSLVTILSTGTAAGTIT